MISKAGANDAAQMFDLLVEGDRTSAELIKEAGWKHRRFLKAIQALRDILAANGDVITVTAEPHRGSNKPWLYSLKAGKAIVDSEQSRWVLNRLQDTERRIETIEHVLDVAVNSLDGRTVAGKKARIYALHLKRAREEVMLVVGEDPLPS